MRTLRKAELEKDGKRLVEIKMRRGALLPKIQKKKKVKRTSTFLNQNKIIQSTLRESEIDFVIIVIKKKEEEKLHPHTITIAITMFLHNHAPLLSQKPISH